MIWVTLRVSKQRSNERRRLGRVVEGSREVSQLRWSVVFPNSQGTSKVNRWAVPQMQKGPAKSMILAFDINWAFDDLMQLVGSGCFHGHAEYEINFMREHALQV